MAPIKRVAVIGGAPAGAIAMDAPAQEKAFDVIRIFERREKAGDCWVQDPKDVVPQFPDIKALANRTADPPTEIPEGLLKYAETSK